MAGRSLLRAGVLAVGSTLAASLGACRPASDPSPPFEPGHVLLLVVDTLRADHVSAWGYERPTTPHIDALAARGVRFSRAVAQCSWTAPSMVSLMTGRYLAGPRLDIPQDVTSLSQVFQAAGYDTAAFISNPLLDEKNGFHRGFDRVQHIPPYQPDAPIVEWIEGQAGKRTFTYVHLNEAHDPYEPPQAFQRWLLDPPPIPEARLDYYRKAAPELVDPEGLDEIRRGLAGYDDDVLYTDQRIGVLLSALERSGQADDAVIVLTADHGEGLWTRPDFFNGPRGRRRDEGLPPSITTTFKMTHGNLVSPELVHVPLIVVAPPLRDVAEPGTEVATWVENVDVGPTLLELCNLADPGGLQGESLVRALDDPGGWVEGKPAVVSSTRFVWSLITQDGWQLVSPTLLGECQEGLVPGLFHLTEDPEARRNLVAEEPERLAAMTRMLEERQSIGLSGHVDPNEETLAALEALGYLDSGIAEVIPDDVRELAVDALLERVVDLERPCLERLSAARALAERDLSAAQAARLADWLPKEPSVVIRALFQDD